MKPICFYFKQVIICILIFWSSSILAQLPSGYSSHQVQNGYSSVMGTVFSDDGSKMFVWEKQGKVYVSNWNGAYYAKQSTPVLDISDEVGDWRDFGFFSFCLDPDFDTNGLVYMFYVVDREHLMDYGTSNYDPNDNDYKEASISRVTRYKLNIGSAPLVADYSSRKVLLGESPSTGVPLLHESHAGGTILFGTDGTLLISTGDNASYFVTDTGSVSHTYYAQALSDGILRPEENVGAFRSQMINSLCGKILRIDPDTGDSLPSNPHYNAAAPRSAASRMWAMGFRNPFRMSLKHDSGSTDPSDGNPGVLFVVDVGWRTWEELHVIDKPGLNAGWPLYEGPVKLNSYYNSGATNPDEGHVPFVNNCPQPNSWNDNTDPAMRRYVHNRPEVSWRHTNAGTSEARVPWFSGSTPTTYKIGESGSPTTGSNFLGNTGVAGVYIVGNEMGLDYKHKYLFTDYTENWIQVATLNDGTQNWFSDISEFAPSFFGSGIVHMIQNPRDGYIYFCNIINGSIYRIINNNPLHTNTDEITNVKVFPNPSEGQLYIEGLKSKAQIKIYTLTGKLIHTAHKYDDSPIELDLNSGLYLLEIIAEDFTTTKKIIIK